MKKIKKAFANPLLAGSVLMIVGSLGASFFSYLYHLVMGKMLGPENYGILAAIISLVGLIGLFPTSLGLVVTKFISAAQTDEEKTSFINFFYRRVIIGGVVTVVILSFLAPVICSFLHISQSLYLILAFMMFLFFIPSMFLRAVLQGLLKFKEYVISFSLENFTKVFMAGLLVLLGLKIIGAVLGLTIGALIGLIFAFIYIKKLIRKRDSVQVFNLKPVAVYALPVLVQSLATTSMYSSDLLLVKHFFSAFDAGIYATLSVLGRIIFFGASPVAAAMFPMVSKRHARGESYKKLLLYSLIATLALSLGVLLIFGLFPGLVLKTLYTSAYLSGVSLLFNFGIFMTLFTLSFLLLNFFLAIGKVRIVILPVITAAIQIVGICLFHNNLAEVIQVSIYSSLILLVGLLGYYLMIESSPLLKR